MALQGFIPCIAIRRPARSLNHNINPREIPATMSATIPPSTKSSPPTPLQAQISKTLQSALSANLLSDTNPAALFYHLPSLLHNVSSLLQAFPSTTLNAFAVKAAPFPALLRHLHRAGMGAECASIAEFALARAASIPPHQIVYDSPAKTRSHLQQALKTRLHLNADSFEELELISQIRDELSVDGGDIGLRVNPQMGVASIAETFTAAAASKFGEPMRERRQDIIDAYLKYDFLNAIHIHVGSQGCEMSLLVDACKEVVALADEINDQGGNIEVIDIGGGLSAEYWHDGEGTTFEEFGDRLRAEVSRLFRYKVVTEFGRRLCASTGFLAALVHSVKRSGGKTYVVCHVGADCLMRPVYQREKWGHRIEIYDSKGQLRQEGEVGVVNVAGPLCFAGDVFAVDREMIIPREGDVLVVRDAGAYTVAMYSRHTSQLVPAIYGVDEKGEIEVLKKQETVEDVVRFWDT